MSAKGDIPGPQGSPDGVVDIEDLIVLLGNFNKVAELPIGARANLGADDLLAEAASSAPLRGRAACHRHSEVKLATAFDWPQRDLDHNR